AVNNSADGSGTETISPTSVFAGTTGNTETLTYTAATGGLKNGAVEVTVPANWSAPSTTSTDHGYTTSSTGTVSVYGQTITVSGVTLDGGATLTVTYANADAPTAAQSGTGTWTTREKSTAGGSLTAIGASPTVAVDNSPDG